MICPKCGTDNPDYFVFCQNCFEELPKVEKPHKSTTRLAETPISRFADQDSGISAPAAPAQPPASTPKPQQAPAQARQAAEAPQARRQPSRSDAQEILNQYATFQEGGPVKNPDEPYLTEKQYTRRPIEREAPRTNFDATQRDTIPVPRPKNLPPLEELSVFEDEDAPPAQSRMRQPAPTTAPQAPYGSGEREPLSRQRGRQPTQPQPAEIPDDEFDIFADELDEAPRRQRKPEKAAKAPKDSKRRGRREGPDDGQAMPAIRANARRPKEAALDAIDEDDKEYFDYYEEDDPEFAKERKRSRIITILFWVALLVLIGAVIFFISSFAIEKYGSLSDAASAVFNISLPGSSQLKSVEATTVADTGEPSHTFIIKGKPNQKLRFVDLDREFDLPDDVKKYEVPDNLWIDETPDPNVETIVVKPNLTIVDVDPETQAVVKETPLDVAEFTVTVPQASVTIDTPQPTDNVVITGDTLEITGSITPANGNGRLYINGEDISAAVGQDGRFSYTYNLAEIGAFSIEVKADAARTRAYTATISGTREKNEVELNVNADVPARTESATLPVSGTTEPGAQLSVDGNIAETEPQVDENGAWSFTAKLDNFGAYNYTLKATADGVTTEKTLTITRMPEVVSYTESAKKLDYAKVKKNPNDSAGNVYRFDAVLVETQTADDGSTRYLMCVDGDSEKPVMATYYGDSALTDGDEYTIYATANKNTEDGEAIQMDAYFVYAAE